MIGLQINKHSGAYLYIGRPDEIIVKLRTYFNDLNMCRPLVSYLSGGPGKVLACTGDSNSPIFECRTLII